MRKLIAAVQMTLDGFISGPNGEMDWLYKGEEVWTELFRDLNSVDTFLVGRKAYPGYAAYWQAVLTNPGSDTYEMKYAKLAENTPHIVFSRTLSNANWKNTRIVKNPEKEVKILKQQSGKSLLVWGGAATISELINLSLVDELRITLAPVVLGKGLALFNNIREQNKLMLIDSRPMNSGAVILRYQVD